MSNKCQLSRKTSIPLIYIGDNIKSILSTKLLQDLEGKCTIEGYVMPSSVNVLSYSSGTIEGADVIFQVVFECNIIHPVEGMLISCEVENITKAGIKAKIPGEVSPLVIFVARDHNFMTSKFNNVNEKDMIVVKVIGQRYEINDKYISVIAEIKDKIQEEKSKLEPTKKIVKKKSLKSSAKPKLILKD
jgi:DNA-directed RNA polymerase subunit E'/Rpb7